LRIQGVMVSLIRRQPNGGSRQQAVSSAKNPPSRSYGTAGAKGR